jgi:hypothetical protein
MRCESGALHIRYLYAVLDVKDITSLEFSNTELSRLSQVNAF